MQCSTGQQELTPVIPTLIGIEKLAKVPKILRKKNRALVTHSRMSHEVTAVTLFFWVTFQTAVTK